MLFLDISRQTMKCNIFTIIIIKQINQMKLRFTFAKNKKKTVFIADKYSYNVSL